MTRKSSTVKVYSVVENTPGYLPDSEPYWTRNKHDAESVAASLARELREDGYTVTGSAREGDYYAERDSHDLGRHVSVNTLDVSREEWDEYQRLSA